MHPGDTALLRELTTLSTPCRKWTLESFSVLPAPVLEHIDFFLGPSLPCREESCLSSGQCQELGGTAVRLPRANVDHSVPILETFQCHSVATPTPPLCDLLVVKEPIQKEQSLDGIHRCHPSTCRSNQSPRRVGQCCILWAGPSWSARDAALPVFGSVTPLLELNVCSYFVPFSPKPKCLQSRQTSKNETLRNRLRE